MELRSCSHLHFIQAVKGGVERKILSVYRGRPALKFKKVKDLYEIKDTENVEVCPAFRPKFEYLDFSIGCDRAKAESLCVSTTETTKIISDGENSVSNGKGKAGEARELGDIDLGSMTLKQIKERCKQKKRKQSKYVELKEEPTETCSLGEQNQFRSQYEDEFDIMEPLSSWKSRILNKKTKRKCGKRSVSASSQNALSIFKREAIPSDQVIFQVEENFPVSIAIKVEAPGPIFSDCKDLIVASVESPLRCNKPTVSCGAVFSEEIKTANGYDLETRIVDEEPYTGEHCVLENGMSVIPGEELTSNASGLEIYMPSIFSNEPQCKALNEETYEEHGKARDLILETEISAKAVEEVTISASGFETQVSTFFTKELQCCSANAEPYEHADPMPIIDIRASYVEEMTNGVAEAICHQFSDLSMLEAKKDDSIIEQRQTNDFQERVSQSKDHVPITYYDPKSSPCVHLKSRKTSSNSQVQVLDFTINNTLEFNEHSKINSSCPSEDEAKDDSLHVQASIISSPVRDCGSLWNSNLSSSPNCSLVSAVDLSPTTEEKRSLLSACADAARNCPAVNYSCIDEPVVSAKVDDHSKLQHPPERLLSTRMAISPTSQKKLRQALESTELDHEQYYKYARKLCYRNLMDNKIGRVITSPKKDVRKPKIANNGFHHNGNVAVPHGSRVVQDTRTACNSVRNCSESAILFSQQQLRDIESVTTKLAKELQSMKGIAEETLQCKIYPATSLTYTEDKIRIAIENATRAEENAKRCLSIMARNCSRFCKIMKLADKGSGTSRNMVPKKRKIVFADEAGGKLCDVKTFQNDVYSFMEPKGD